jgi:hypothetical protein
MTDVTQDNKLVSLGRALAVWVVIIVAESLHGIARVVFLQPRVGDFKARQIAVFTGSAMILAIAGASVRWIGAARVSALLRASPNRTGLTQSAPSRAAMTPNKSSDASPTIAPTTNQIPNTTPA